jgi:hypothetical protein
MKLPFQDRKPIEKKILKFYLTLILFEILFFYRFMDHNLQIAATVLIANSFIYGQNARHGILNKIKFYLVHGTQMYFCIKKKD